MTDILTVADGQNRLYRSLATNATNIFSIQTGAAIAANESDVYKISSDNGVAYSSVVGFNIPKMRVLEEVWLELTMPRLELETYALSIAADRAAMLANKGALKSRRTALGAGALDGKFCSQKTGSGTASDVVLPN